MPETTEVVHVNANVELDPNNVWVLTLESGAIKLQFRLPFAGGVDMMQLMGKLAQERIAALVPQGE